MSGQISPFRHGLAVVSDILPPMQGEQINLAAFETWMRSWGASETTIKGRMWAVRAIAREYDLLTATPQHLEQWMSDPAFSGWTRCTYFTHLRSVFEWMRKAGLRPDDPTTEMRRPSAPKCVPRPLSGAEVALALAAATGRRRAWLLLGMFAGLRAHEIAKLRGEDVTQTALYVVGKGNRAAFLPTHYLLWDLAQTMPRRGWWFPSRQSATGHIASKTVTNGISGLFAQLGIPGSSHRARHTYGTNLLRGGANIRVVQELMRHESLATTQIYTEVAEDEMRHAIGSLGLPLSA